LKALIHDPKLGVLTPKWEALCKKIPKNHSLALDPSAAEFRAVASRKRVAQPLPEKNSARRRASRNLWTPPPPYFFRRAAALVKNRVAVHL